MKFRFRRLYAVVASIMLLGGCVRAMLPTSAEELEGHSYRPRSVIVDQDYIALYARLKMMHVRCYRSIPPHTIYISEGRLNRETGVAQVTLSGAHGTIFHLIKIERATVNESRISALLAKNKIINHNKSETSINDSMLLFKAWAEGSKTSC
jgi:hypothetical protein